MNHDVEMTIDRCALHHQGAIVVGMNIVEVATEAMTGMMVVERVDQGHQWAAMDDIGAEVQEDEIVMMIRHCHFPREIRGTSRTYRSF